MALKHVSRRHRYAFAVCSVGCLALGLVLLPTRGFAESTPSEWSEFALPSIDPTAEPLNEEMIEFNKLKARVVSPTSTSLDRDRATPEHRRNLKKDLSNKEATLEESDESGVSKRFCWKSKAGCDINDLGEALDKITNLEKYASTAKHLHDTLPPYFNGDRLIALAKKFGKMTLEEIRSMIYSMAVSDIAERIKAEIVKVKVAQQEKVDGNVNAKNAIKGKLADPQVIVDRFQELDRPPRSFSFSPEIESAISNITAQLDTIERKPLNLTMIQNDFAQKNVTTVIEALDKFVYVAENEYGIKTVADLISALNLYASKNNLKTVDQFIDNIEPYCVEVGAEELIFFLELMQEVAADLGISDFQDLMDLMLEIFNQYDVEDLTEFVVRLGAFAAKYGLDDVEEWASTFSAEDAEQLMMYVENVSEGVGQRNDNGTKIFEFLVSNEDPVDNLNHDREESTEVVAGGGADVDRKDESGAKLGLDPIESHDEGLDLSESHASIGKAPLKGRIRGSTA